MTLPDDFFTSSSIRLPSPPNIAVSLLKALKKDDFSFRDIAKIIQSDPALAAKVLKVVNSPIYLLPRKVSSIELALSVMGVNAVKNIALSFILIDGMKMKSEAGFDLDAFWRKSITAAVSAELFAAHLGIASEDAFVTALLQDIGTLILCYSRPGDYPAPPMGTNEEQLAVEELEDRAFGFNHQEVGSELLFRWGLPENIFMPIRYHHQPDKAPEANRRQARILCLADRAALLYTGRQSAAGLRETEAILREGLGRSDSAFSPLIDEVACKSLEILTSFEIPHGEMKPFSILLQDANEGLSDLNLSYEMLLAELKRKKKQAERLASQLKKANHQLMELSMRDSLTGLYNRRYLYDFLAGEVSRARRNGESFSFILMDIDFFKKVNDTFGHLSGDIILKAVSDRILGMKRRYDVVARYGGEEFAVVLPNTDMQEGLSFSERCRKAIEEMGCALRGSTVKVTISAGVSLYNPKGREISIENLMDRADRALYRAKNSGRNKVLPSDD